MVVDRINKPSRSCIEWEGYFWGAVLTHSILADGDRRWGGCSKATHYYNPHRPSGWRPDRAEDIHGPIAAFQSAPSSRMETNGWLYFEEDSGLFTSLYAAL